jgi:hypothetical protein
VGRRRLRAGILTATLALLGGAVTGVAPARAATFTLSGTVADNSSTPVVDVVVDVLDPPTGNVVATATTDGTGHYAVSVAQGTYDVRFTPPSGSALAPATISGEDVATDTVLDVVLQPFPVVTVVAPRYGQTVSDYYDLAATTSAPVDRVEFYIDDVLIGQATVGLGWNYHWNSTTVAEGGHKIQAKAYVGAASALSAPVLFNVKQFAPGQVVDWGQTTTFPAGGWVRMTKLRDGVWLAATTVGITKYRAEVWIYKSTDSARTWTRIATVADGDRLLGNPNLLKVPKGDVLLATRNWVNLVSYRISVWRSSDNGMHWTGPVKVAGNENPQGNQYLNMSEPWLFFLPDGRVSIMYADATQAAIGFRQRITQKISPDSGRTWGSLKIFAAALQDNRSRPGMPVVIRMKNGQYLLLFELGDNDNFYVHYKRSSDGITWTSDLGTRISTSQQGGPGAVSMSNGRVIVTSNTRAVSYSNDYGKTWQSNDPAFTDSAYWPALYEIGPGLIADSVSLPTRIRFGLVKSL